MMVGEHGVLRGTPSIAEYLFQLTNLPGQGRGVAPPLPHMAGGLCLARRGEEYSPPLTGLANRRTFLGNCGSRPTRVTVNGGVP